MLEPWDETLSVHGAKVLLKRALFFEEFAPFITRAYGAVAQETETPSVEYMPQVAAAPHDSPETIYGRLREKLEEKRRDELRIGSTLVGPHRDEAAFSLNGLQLAWYASQGQHKTFLIALKIAEFFYLNERCAETPVILLDIHRHVGAEPPVQRFQHEPVAAEWDDDRSLIHRTVAIPRDQPRAAFRRQLRGRRHEGDPALRHQPQPGPFR